MGMVDQSSLHERNAPSPKDISLDQDDSLFVSSIGNGVPEPVVEISDSPLGSESPAPNSPSIFQNSTPPTTVNIPVTTQPSALPATSQPVNPFQAPQPPNPFGSMFSGTASNESTPVTTSAATPAVPSNPFAASQTSQSQSPFQTSSSPFAFPKPTEPAEATGKEDTPAVSAAETPNPFGNFKPSQTLSNPLGSSPAPPQTSSIFTNGGLSNGTAEQSAGIPNPFASSLGQKPSETPKEAGSSTTSTSAAQQTPSFFAPTKSPFSPVEAKEPVSQNTTSTGIFAQTTKPFNFPTPQNTSQSSQLSASIGPGISFTQESSTIFESVKPPSFSGFSNPPWFAPPNDANKETKNTQAPTATPTFDFSKSVPAKPQPLPSLFQPTSAGPSLFTHPEISSSKPLFSPANPPVQPTSETKTKDSDEGDHEARDEPKLRKPDGAVKIDGKEKETTTAHVMSPEPSKAFTQQVDTPEEPLQLPAFSSPQNLDPPGNSIHSFPTYLKPLLTFF